MGKRRDNDNYDTPPALAHWAVNRAIQLAGLPGGQYTSILEPCCGDNAPFLAAGRELGINYRCGFDLRDIPKIETGTDAGDTEQESSDFIQGNVDIFGIREARMSSKVFDIVATNPPFIIGEDVVKISLGLLDERGVAAFLVKQQFLGTQARAKFMISRPPAEVWILTQRPSFTGDGKTDVATEYCIAFWHGVENDRQLRILGQRATRLYWLENKNLGKPVPGKGRVLVEKKE